MRQAIRRGAVAGVMACLAVAIAVSAYAQAKTDVSGTWTFKVETQAGTGTPTVTLKQDGENLTGHYSSETLGEADLTGTVKGNDIAFAFNASVQGMEVAVSYKGTVDSNTAMKGTLNIAGLADGNFTATRK